MSRFIPPDDATSVNNFLLGFFGNDPRERFLLEELSRYVPQLNGMSKADIANFLDYQRSVYLAGIPPQIGRPIASMNPTFALMEDLKFSIPGKEVYTRASVKANGFRMQLHIGPAGATAFTRQFTPYDLRLFPELTETLAALPVMIADVELVMANHKHNASLNRLQSIRLPGTSYWPARGQNQLPDEVVGTYLADPAIFKDGQPHEDLRVTLIFHGLYAIADISTWNMPREIQLERLVPLSLLPINYIAVDTMLWALGNHGRIKKWNMSIAGYIETKDLASLQAFFSLAENSGEEGLVVVQSIQDAKTLRFETAPHAIKVKRYETIDMALLGFRLIDPTRPAIEVNIGDAILGLYDERVGTYVPATKVNLNPSGVQVKEDHQLASATALRHEIAQLAQGRILTDTSVRLLTLNDLFVREGAIMLRYLLGADREEETRLESMITDIPQGRNLVMLYEMLLQKLKKVNDLGVLRKTKSTRTETFYNTYGDVLVSIASLDKQKMKRFRDYFGRVADIHARARAMPKADVLLDMGVPIIVEVRVVGIRWGESAYPAGFHSWYGHSLIFTNNYILRTRPDKLTTTDYATIHTIARRDTPRHIRQGRTKALPQPQ